MQDMGACWPGRWRGCWRRRRRRRRRRGRHNPRRRGQPHQRHGCPLAAAGATGSRQQQGRCGSHPATRARPPRRGGCDASAPACDGRGWRREGSKDPGGGVDEHRHTAGGEDHSGATTRHRRRRHAVLPVGGMRGPRGAIVLIMSPAATAEIAVAATAAAAAAATLAATAAPLQVLLHVDNPADATGCESPGSHRQPAGVACRRRRPLQWREWMGGRTDGRGTLFKPPVHPRCARCVLAARVPVRP
ncbi:hypothetical protein I4F81_006187 [Pyropia yezoensis]|uniref:Uncharacterized protein n=1 Tax=Pyropia yezoensis TaxID=2788 RepID=A0ACC3C0J6_PYRYE|nr:hypothetical protein I4F81_006187 [Neopyropia yezoensis]